jgi:hypothetical protein
MTPLAGVAGVALMTLGMASFGYGTYLEMSHAANLWWWDRTVLLVPLGLAAMLGGMALFLGALG